MILPAAHQQGNNCHYGSPATFGKHVSHIITACVCEARQGGRRGGPLISFDAVTIVFGEATLRQSRSSCQWDEGPGGQSELLSSRSDVCRPRSERGACRCGVSLFDQRPGQERARQEVTELSDNSGRLLRSWKSSPSPRCFFLMPSSSLELLPGAPPWSSSLEVLQP